MWNQDVVPFLIVNTRDTIRLYSGFRYRQSGKDDEKGLLRIIRDFNECADLAEGFRADAIDNGQVWKVWGNEVTPDKRVDWKLLENLRSLDQYLQKSCNLKKEISHALIGKYVYLHYLKDRDILSQRKLTDWTINTEEIFGRNAILNGLKEVVRKLDEWLNGGVFPLVFSGESAPKQKHVQCVAAAFSGDEISEEGLRQLHLDFQAYDFSYIPIETLSVIYEQFLHDSSGKTNRGKEAGAYYTPIPVVNFMLAELEERHPLKRGMRVFDPSCGSGAFLVQCYRRLIENEFPTGGIKPRPVELRELLKKHIFGVDYDPDACSVTELSLILTLLDYVEPPD